MGHVKLSLDGADIVGNLIARDRSIKTLVLDSNELGPDGTEAIASMLRQNHTMRALAITNNDLGDQGALNFAAILRSGGSSIEELNLERNGIGEEGLVALKEMVIVNTKI